MRLKGAGNDQQMMIEHWVFVEQRDMGGGDVRHIHLGFVGQEGVNRLATPARCRSGLTGEARDLPHVKIHPGLFDPLFDSRDRLQRTGL